MNFNRVRSKSPILINKYTRDYFIDMSTNVEMGRDTCVYGVIKVGLLGENFHTNIRPSHFNMSEYEIRHFFARKNAPYYVMRDISMGNVRAIEKRGPTLWRIANCPYLFSFKYIGGSVFSFAFDVCSINIKRLQFSNLT